MIVFCFSDACCGSQWVSVHVSHVKITRMNAKVWSLSSRACDLVDWDTCVSRAGLKFDFVVDSILCV